jgi:hypothetical protein
MSIAKNKAELIQIIKDWITTDNEIRELNKQAKQRKDKLNKISQNLMNTMKENEIDEFNVNDGKIMYAKTSVKKPITKKNLLSILSKYYKGDTSQATDVNNFILDNREEVVKETIKRTIVKKTNYIFNEAALSK